MKKTNIKKVQRHSVGEASRYIFCLDDDSIVEMAVFVHKDQTHFCVSTQVGCPVGCLHCATTYSSVQYLRNLTVEELREMVQYALSQDNSYNKNILSFSGHGEPMLNWDVVTSIKLAFWESFEKIYVTTIGNRNIFAQLENSKELDIVFYLSLHGSTDKERSLIIPDSIRFSTIDELLGFTRWYSGIGGKIVINYMLHRGNSSRTSLDRLIQLLYGCNQNVSIRFTDFNRIEQKTNIIPLDNFEIKNVLSYIESKKPVKAGWTFRYSQLEGGNIGIACGQLRADIMDKEDR